MLSFEQLREVNLQRCTRWHPGGIEEWSLSDWGVATGGEMGEALNIIKKMNRERDKLVGNAAGTNESVLHQALADELADIAIYLDLLAARASIDLADAVARKFNAVSVKNNFPERL